MIKMTNRKKKAENENEGVIHRDIIENEPENNQDTLKEAI